MHRSTDKSLCFDGVGVEGWCVLFSLCCLQKKAMMGIVGEIGFHGNTSYLRHVSHSVKSFTSRLESLCVCVYVCLSKYDERMKCVYLYNFDLCQIIRTHYKMSMSPIHIINISWSRVYDIAISALGSALICRLHTHNVSLYVSFFFFKGDKIMIMLLLSIWLQFICLVIHTCAIYTIWYNVILGDQHWKKFHQNSSLNQQQTLLRLKNKHEKISNAAPQRKNEQH